MCGKAQGWSPSFPCSFLHFPPSSPACPSKHPHSHADVPTLKHKAVVSYCDCLLRSAGGLALPEEGIAMSLKYSGSFQFHHSLLLSVGKIIQFQIL